MSTCPSPTKESSSDDDIFTQRMEFTQPKCGPPPSFPCTVECTSTTACDEVTSVSESGPPPMTREAKRAVSSAVDKNSNQKDLPLPDAASLVASEQSVLHPLHKSVHVDPKVKGIHDELEAQQRQPRCSKVAEPRSSADSLGTTTDLTGEPTQPQEHPVTHPISKFPLAPFDSHCLSGSPQRASTPPVSAVVLGSPARQPGASALSTPTGMETAGRRGSVAHRQRPRSTATTPLREPSSLSAAPVASCVDTRLLSDEAYLDMFHIPTLVAQLSLSLMAAKPPDLRAFTRDWLADRLVSEDDHTYVESVNSGTDVRQQGSQSPPGNTHTMTRSAGLHSGPSLVIQGRRCGAKPSMACGGGTQRLRSGQASSRQRRQKHPLRPRLRPAISDMHEASDSANKTSVISYGSDDDEDGGCGEKKCAASTGQPTLIVHSKQITSSLSLSNLVKSACGECNPCHLEAEDAGEQRRAQETFATTQQGRMGQVGKSWRLAVESVPSTSSTSVSADGGSSAWASLSAAAAPHRRRVGAHRHPQVTEQESSRSTRQTGGENGVSGAAALGSLPIPETPLSVSESSLLSSPSTPAGSNPPGSGDVELAGVDARSQPTTPNDCSSSSSSNRPLSHSGIPTRGEVNIEASTASMTHGTPDNRREKNKSLTSSCTVDTVFTSVAESGKTGHVDFRNESASSSGADQHYASDRGILTTSVPSASTVALVSIAFGMSAEENPILAAQEQGTSDKEVDRMTLRTAEVELGNNDPHRTHKGNTGTSVATSSSTQADSKRDVTRGEESVVCASDDGEVQQVNPHDQSSATGSPAPTRSSSHEDENDAAQENGNEGGNSDINFAIFVPILAVDTTTNEVIDYRVSGVPPPSPPFLPVAGCVTGAPSSSVTSSAGGIGSGHPAQGHTPAAVMPPSGFPAHGTRPVSTTFNVLPTPMLADLVGGAGITNASFARRGVPNTSFSRRSANVTSAATRYADPAAAAVGWHSPSSTPFITPRALAELPVAVGSGAGVFDERLPTGIQTLTFRRSSATLSVCPTGSEACTRTSGTAGIVAGGTSVLDSKSLQTSHVTDASIATLHGCSKGEANRPVRLAEDAAGSATAFSATPSPLSTEMKRESARRLGKLLDQLPSGKYAAAIVFLEGLISSSGGDSDVTGTPETAAISMITSMSDASNCSHGLFKITKGAADVGLEGRGPSGEGQSPLMGLHTSGRLWVGAHGRETSPTALPPNLARLGNRGGETGPVLVASGSNEGGVALSGGVSRAPEDPISPPVSRVDSASVEALVRDALSQSVLQSLSPAREEVSRPAPSLSVGVEVSARGVSDSTGGDENQRSPSSVREDSRKEGASKTAAATTRTVPSPVSLPVSTVFGNRRDGLISNSFSCDLQQGSLSLSRKLSDADATPVAHHAFSSPPPDRGAFNSAVTPTQQQQQQHLVAREATEEHRDINTSLPPSLPTPESAPSSNNSGPTLSEVPLARPPSKEEAAPDEDHSHSAITHLQEPSQQGALRHGLFTSSTVPPAETHNKLTSSLNPNAEVEGCTATFPVTALTYPMELPLLGGIASSSPAKGIQASPDTGDENTMTHLDLGGGNSDAGSNLDVCANEGMSHTQVGPDGQNGLAEESVSPTMEHQRAVESAALLSITESLPNSSTGGGGGSQSTDSYLREHQEGWRHHARTTCEASDINMLGHSLETFEDTHLSGSAAPTTIRERPGRGQRQCPTAAKFSSAPPKAIKGVVGWGDVVSDSPAPNPDSECTQSAGDEVGFDNVDLGGTLRRAVALAAVAGTNSERKTSDAHTEDKYCEGKGIIRSSSSMVSDRLTGHSITSEGGILGRDVVASEKRSAAGPLALETPKHLLHTTKPTDTAPRAFDTSEPSESPLVTSSVVVAMNSFFSREDQIVLEEVNVVREVVANYDAFAALDETQLETLVRTMTRVELQRGATVVCEGDQTLLQLLFVISGKLAVSRRGLVTRTLTRGHFYGEMEMSYHVERSRVTLTAAAPTVVLYGLKKADYQKLVLHEKDARRYMFLQYVNECVLFKEMSPHIKMRLADSFRVCRLRKGTKLTEQGAPVQWMYLLMSGNVHMTYRGSSGFGGDTSDGLDTTRYPEVEEEGRHITTTSCPPSNYAGSTTVSEALMSSGTSVIPAATMTGNTVLPPGNAACLVSSHPPPVVDPQEPSSTALAQVATATSSMGAQHPTLLLKSTPSFSTEFCRRNSFSTVTAHSHGAVAPPQHLLQPLQLLDPKEVHGNTHSETGDHFRVQGGTDGSQRPFDLHPRSRRFANQSNRSASDWQVPLQLPYPAGEFLDMHGHELLSSQSMPMHLLQSMNPLPNTSANSYTSNIASPPPTSAVASPTGVFGGSGVAVAVERSRGQLVGETEFVFKCQGLFTAVATTPVQAARISRLHFEAIMTCSAIEEMKRSMLLNPDYYFFESTVPEDLKEEMRRMLFRLNVGLARRRHRGLAHQQHFLRSATGIDCTVPDSLSGGVAREKGFSKSGRCHSGRNAGSLRCTQRGHYSTSFTNSVAGGNLGSSSGFHGIAGSSGPRRPPAALLEQGYIAGCLATEKVGTHSFDTTMEFSGMCHLAASGLHGSPVANSALTNLFSSPGAGEALGPRASLLAVTGSGVDGGRGKASSSDGGHHRHLRTTAPLSTANRRTSVTKQSSTTGSRRRRVSTRGEIVFSGSRNLYRFSAEAMNVNESVLIAVVVDGTIIRWNSVAQNVTGYAPLEVIGKSIFDFIVSDDGRQHMRDTLAFAARFAGKWEQYSMHGLQEQRVFPFRQNTGLYQVGLALSVIPSNCSKTAEVLLLIGREGKYRAASTYAADVAKWLEGSLKPQLRQFQRRMAQIESRNWQVTTEDVLQVRGNLDACMSMVEQFTKFSMLNVEVVSQSWRPVRIPALLRRFAMEATEFARQQQHEYYCNIDLVEPKGEVFLDAQQVLTILRLLLSDTLQCPNLDDGGHPIVTHAELRVTVVVPQGTNLVSKNVKSPTGPILLPASPPKTSSEDRSGGGAEGLRNAAMPEIPLTTFSRPLNYAPGSAVDANLENALLTAPEVSVPPEASVTAQPSPDGSLLRDSVLQAHTHEPHLPRENELAPSDQSGITPLLTLANQGNPNSGGNAQTEANGSPIPVAGAPPSGSAASSGTEARCFTSVPITNTLAATLRRIRFELRDDGPSIPSLRDPKTVANERASGNALSESPSVDVPSAVAPCMEISPISVSRTSEPACDKDVAEERGHDSGPDTTRKLSSSMLRGASLEQVEKILANLGGVVYGFTRPEVQGNVVRVELPLLTVPGSTEDVRDDENGGCGAGGGLFAPLPGAARTLTVIVADSNRMHQQQLCRVLWARQHAVVPVTNFHDLGRKLETNTADILLIDPLHLDVGPEDYEYLLGDDPFDDIRILSARLALVVMASDFSDWRVQKLLNRHAVVELPKVGSGALIHIAMQEAEQLVMEMRDEEERLELIRRTFTNSSTERHKVGKRVGRGTFGDVFEVEDTLTGGKMAMKRMRLHDGLLADEVVHEILAMSMLKHENIIQYFYCEKESDTMLRIYMELAPGGTLRDKIRELPGVPLPFGEIVHHLSCICHGLAYVHEQCFVHGDLKTANLLLGTRNRTKIGDFGTVKRLAPHDHLYAMVGTPQYMAPEVLNADAEQRLGYDFKADIWSLGCIVLEMATGSPPFAHVECAQGMGIIKYLTELTDTPDLSPLFSGNPLVYEFVKSCLEIDPQNRPTAQELLHFDILEGAVASQRAERLVRRAETLYKLNKYAAMRANDSGGRIGAMRFRSKNGSEDSEDRFESDDDDSSLYESGLLFSNSNSSALDEDLDDDDDYVNEDDDDEEEVVDLDGSEIGRQDNYTLRCLAEEERIRQELPPSTSSIPPTFLPEGTM